MNDQARWLELAESAASFAGTVLGRDGALLVKLFQGAETDSFLRTLRERFASVAVRSRRRRENVRPRPMRSHADGSATRHAHDRSLRGSLGYSVILGWIMRISDEFGQEPNRKRCMNSAYCAR